MYDANGDDAGKGVAVMADRRRLFVSPEGGRWKVQWEGGQVDGRHDTQAAAISRARAIVRGLVAGECS